MATLTPMHRSRTGPGSRQFMLTANRLYAALIIVSCAWILRGFTEAILAACAISVASWPLYEKLRLSLPPRLRPRAASLIFTAAMTLFVLAPMMFASGAVLTEAHALLLEIAAADKKGIAAPAWLDSVPLAGPWLSSRWQAELAQPGALASWAHRADTAVFLSWAQALGQFTLRHLLIVVFTVLLLAYLYQEGESLAEDGRRLLRSWIGSRAEGYADLSVRATRASVNSMLVVALFDGFACWAAFAVAGAPHAALWAAIAGLLELVPFLGYAAVAALTLQLAVQGAETPALVSCVLGSIVLFCGDKVVRPLVARDAMRLGFVWILMGCLGGFEALGLAGLIIGPVVLTLAKEMWGQRVRDLAHPGVEE